MRMQTPVFLKVLDNLDAMRYIINNALRYIQCFSGEYE